MTGAFDPATAPIVTTADREAALAAAMGSDTAAEFCRILHGDGPLTCQSFDDRKEKNPKLAQVIIGTFEETADKLLDLNRQGAGIFVTVNRGDGKGRKAENIIGIQALFLDLDGAPLRPVEEADPLPHLITETSPGHYQAIYKVHDCPLERFEELQVALAEKFGGDPSVKDLPRVCRMPGFYHQKGAPFLSRLLRACDEPAYAIPELTAGLGLVIRKPERKAKAAAVQTNGAGHHEPQREYCMAALRNERERVRAQTSPGRHETLFSAAASLAELHGLGQFTKGECREALRSASAANGSLEDYGEKEFERTFSDGWEAGLPNQRRPADTGRTYGRSGAAANADEAGNDKAGPAPSESIALFDPTTLEGKAVPEREWVVADWIPAKGVTAQYGDGGTGKSLLGQQLVTCCSAGLPFMGIPTLHCKAIAMFCEDDDAELHRRQVDINRHYGLTFADLGNLRWQSRVGFNNLLIEFDNGGKAALTELFAELLKAAVEFAAKLVLLDTAADIFGGNENIRPQVRQFIQQCCGRLARAIDGCVIFCAHPSRAGLATGEGDGASTAWNNSVRSRLYLSKPKADDSDEAPDNGLRILTRKKANYAASGETLELRWEAGVFINTKPTGIFAGMDNRAAESAFLTALHVLTEEKRFVSHSPNSTNYAPKMMKPLAAVKGFKVGDLAKAMERLFADRKIKVADYGMPSQGKTRIEQMEADCE